MDIEKGELLLERLKADVKAQGMLECFLAMCEAYLDLQMICLLYAAMRLHCMVEHTQQTL